MANGLTQAQKDEANAKIKEIVANGGGQAEIDAFKADFEAKLSAAGGQTDAPAQPVDTDLASDGSSSDFPSYKDLNDQKQVGKQPRRDEDGEVINLAEEFGDFGAAIESIPFFGDFIDDMWGAVKTGRTQARAVDDNLNLFKEGADISEEDLTEYMARAQEMQDRPPSKEMQDFNRIYEEEGGGTWGFIKGIAQNPSVAFETMTSSIIAMANPAGLAAAGAGAAGGAAVGTLAAGPVGTAIGATSGMMAGLSGTLDAALSTQEFLQEEVEHAGLEFDREGIRAILENPEALSRIRTKAAARGTVVGLVDGITGGIAGKVGVGVGRLARGAGKTAKFAKRAAGGAALGIEAAGGGLGETGARVAAGQELDAREIGLEIVGEFASATPIAATARKILGKEEKESAEINGQELDTEEVSQFVNEATDEDIVFSDVKIPEDPAAETVYKERRYGADYEYQQDFLTDEEKASRESIKTEIDEIGIAAQGASPEVKKTLLSDVKDLQKELKSTIREQEKRVNQMSAEDAQKFQDKNKDISRRKDAIQALQDKKTDENASSIDKAIARQQEKIAEAQEEADTIAGASQAVVEQNKAKYQAQKQAKEAEQTAIEEEEIAQADPVAAQQKEAKQEIIKEDVQDNEKNYEGITDLGRDLGVFEIENTDPATASVEDYAPLTQKGKTFSQGDFVKKLAGPVPSVFDYNQLKYDMEKQAKSQGFEITIPESQNAEIDAEGQPIFTAEISKPREESLTKQVESVAAPQEEAVEGEERQPVDYATDVAAEAGAEVTETTPGTFDLNVGPESATSERRAAHKLLNGLKKRGHKQAKLIEGEDGNFQVVAGPREEGEQVEYSLDESRIPELTEKIKSDRPGKITHQKARNLAIEQLRRERDGDTTPVEYSLDEPSNLTQESDQKTYPKKFKQHQDLRTVAGNRVKLNIGLENNPVDNIDGIIRELKKNPAVRLGSTEQVDGEYNGQPERTVVVDAKYDGTAREFKKYIEKLNANLTQEAIGVQFNGRGSLVYDPKFKGERNTFSSEYFLQPTRTSVSGAPEETAQSAREATIAKTIPRTIPGGKKAESFSPRNLVDVNLEGRKQEYIQGTRGDRTVGPEDPNIILGKDVVERTPQGEPVAETTDQQKRVKSRIAELEKIKKEDPDLFTPKQQKTLDLLNKKNEELSAGRRKFAREGDLAKATEGKVLSDDVVGNWANNKSEANKEEAILSSLGYADAIAKRAQRSKNIDQDVESTLTEEQIESAKNIKSLDSDISQAIQALVSEAYNTGKVGGQEFNPTNAVEAKQKLGGLVRDAVRNHYLKEGAPHGTTGRHSKSNARLNNIRSAVRQLEKAEGIQAEGAVKIGGKGATKAVKIDATNPTAVANLLNEGFHSLQNGKRVFKQDTDITPDQVQDILAAEAQFEGSPVQEGTALDEILPASEIEARGDNQVSELLGVTAPGPDTSVNEIAELIDYKDLKKNYKKVAKAVTADLEGAKKVADYFKRKFIDNEEALSKPQREFKRAVAKFIAAEPASLGKPKREGTRSPEFNLTERFNPLEAAPQEYIDRVSAVLKKAFPGITVASSPEAYNKALEGIKTPPGVKGAYITAKNTVAINPSKATLDTPLHEFSHIWAKSLQLKNPKLWKRGVELLKGSEYARKVYDNPTYREYLKNEPARFWEEVMANALGKRGAEIFTKNSKDAGKWNSYVKSVGNWLKSKLGIASKNDYANLTLDDWLNAGVGSILTGDATALSPTSDVSFNLEEDPASDPDVSAATIEGKKAEGKWYTKPFKWLIPPAADDYHGLVSKLKSVPAASLKKVKDAFVNNHHAYVEASTKVRDKVSKIAKNAGFKLDAKNVTTVNGAKLNAAQAIQAHVNGYANSFSKKPEVQKYIQEMQDLGVLKPKERYDTASPQADIVGYVINDLYEKHFGEFNKVKNEVFDKNTMAQITKEHGDKYAKALENSLQRMSSGKTQGLVDSVTGKWNDWALGSVGTIMFLNFRSAALQMLSVGNYGFAAKNPMAFVGHMFNPNTFAEAKKLFNSSYLKERRARAGFDVNAREMLDLLGQSNTFSEFTKKVLNKGFAATSLVDSVAIAFGGAAFIKAQQGSGVSRAEAISQWKEQTEEAQQSSRPDRVSQWQTSGVSKFVLAFANTPQQYFRLGQKAFRTLKNPKATSKEKGAALARIGWYMAAQNMIFTALQSASLAMLGGLDSDDDKERAEAENQYNSMLNTLLRGMGLYGAVFGSLKDVALKGIQEERKINPNHVNTALKATSISPPLNRKISDLLAIGRAQKYDKDKTGIESAEATAIAKGTTVLTNLPTDWVQKKGIAVKNAWDDQYGAWQKLLMIMGYAPHTLDTKGGDEFDFNFDDVNFDDVEFEDFEDVEF